ncbi:MAG: hypothetical protein H6767_08380 [Candidatus Peribacteria bacterium]|nr:MAG: hypothetical protein H6767_08380 [Candidatus Peribacteria bacterium]
MVLLGLKEIIGDDICPHTFFIIGGGGNNVFIETFFLSHIRSGKLSGVRFIKDAQIYTPEVKKISTIIGIEDILSKSNINMVAMIISMHTILQRQHDAVEISLQKAIKKLEMS